MPLSEIVIASHNRGKIAEIEALLSPLAIKVISAADLHLAEPEETGLTFAENARIKSLAAAQASGKAALSDDSGLAVALLDGAPGIYSARWAGVEKDFTRAAERIRQELLAKNTEAEGAEAAFVCVLSLCLPDGREYHFEGRVEGTLTFPPRGEKGFGYDPIFIAQGYHKTFAEIPAEEKHRISHRAAAFHQLLTHLRHEE